MTRSDSPKPTDHNPFSTGDVRPGALPFRFGGATDVDPLIDTLRKNRWWGEIVGPHGSGKSTLLCTLIPHLEAIGRTVCSFTLHQGERRLPVDAATMDGWGEQAQLVIDGYEQLSAWNCWRLRRHCRRRRIGLLVTSHRPVGLPTLFETCTSPELAVELVHELMPDGLDRLDPADVCRSFDRNAGNLREVFFDLYDLYEQRGDA